MKKEPILLVDDEEEFVTTLSERLELRNISNIVATDGVEALRMIDKYHPQLIVLDVMMPGLGGFDLLKQIKKNDPHTQVILLTGRGSTKDGIKGMRYGAFDYLMKPVDIDDLIQKMNEALQVSNQD